MALENEETPVVEASTEISTNEASKPEFDRPALETKVSGGLAALFADEDEDNSSDEVEAAETPAASDEDAGKEGNAGDDDNAEVDEEKEAATPPAAEQKLGKTGNAPTLPAAYRRSLKAYGWEDEDIDTNLKALGASFITTAQKIHSNRNQEVQGWAEAGRAARERVKAADTTQVTPQQAAAGQALKPIDMTAVKAHFGEDKMIDTFFAPVNAMIEKINTLMPQIEKTQANSQQAEMAALGQQIEEFFGGEDLKPYAKLYGDPKSGLEDAHFKARNKVLETADALQHGAYAQGRKLSLKDAMQIAHDSISTGFKVEAVRKEIKAKLKTRAAGITLKPGNKGSVAGSGPVKNQADLEKRTAQRLKAVFA